MTTESTDQLPSNDQSTTNAHGYLSMAVASLGTSRKLAGEQIFEDDVIEKFEDTFDLNDEDAWVSDCILQLQQLCCCV